jgi:hypothetical protein
VTNETQILLCKPLNARKLSFCSISLMDLEPRRWNRGDRGKPQHYSTGDQELHVPSMSETGGRQSHAFDRRRLSGWDHQMTFAK